MAERDSRKAAIHITCSLTAGFPHDNQDYRGVVLSKVAGMYIRHLRDLSRSLCVIIQQDWSHVSSSFFFSISNCELKVLEDNQKQLLVSPSFQELPSSPCGVPGTF